MTKECVIYRDLLTAYKAIKATYNDDYSPNKAVWRMTKRVILNAQAALGVAEESVRRYCVAQAEKQGYDREILDIEYIYNDGTGNSLTVNL